jgi:alkanesulfonate monooxygenase SsuD/methylene tetrahydromethanopterin reductase-like flavin-dependent oxidoreductase (luciferase family)
VGAHSGGAQQAERLGFESVWLFDHFHTVPRPTDEITFESFTSLSALAALTERVHLGQIVICNGFRNPALTAKMAATLDTISGGRFELGIGAGWKRDEWLAYGYGFPETAERLRCSTTPSRSSAACSSPERRITPRTRAGIHRVADARNVPKPIQPTGMPIMVGGNGPNVTWRLAARYADELNLDGLSPDEVREALPTIRARCEEIDRDPDSLAVSVHAWWGMPDWSNAGPDRQAFLAEYAELGCRGSSASSARAPRTTTPSTRWPRTHAPRGRARLAARGLGASARPPPR